MAQTPAAFGLYPSTKTLYVGAEALRAAKFRQTDISVMYADGWRALRLQERPAVDASVVDDHADDNDGPESLVNLLTSLSGVGAIVLGDEGAFMAGGPILATVSPGDTLWSSLCSLGMPEGEVASFEERLRAGGVLLSVQCDDDEWAMRAREILSQTGAERIAATAAAAIMPRR